MSSVKIIELNTGQVQELMQRLDNHELLDEDYEILKVILDSYQQLGNAYLDKTDSIKRLLRIIFGAKTESSKDVLDKPSEDDPPDDPEKKEPKKRKGHGKKGADAHTGANRILVPHESLKHGDPCLLCPNGKVYIEKTPAKVIRFTGQPPVCCTVYELERLRCNLCGAVFTASSPEDARKDTYDEKAVSMIGCLKYGSGVPFYRLAKLQESLGIFLPPSNQWEVLNTAAEIIQPVFEALIRQGACGEILHHDDTTVKILELVKDKNAERKGMYTTGMVCMNDGVKIALFFSGSQHAGENMDDVLKERAKGLSPPIVMCDALSRNIPKDFAVLLANCLSHGRRNFVEIIPNFPEQCTYVIETLAEVYKNDAFTRTHNMTADERLEYHQSMSGPLMEKLHIWLEDQIDNKKAEPNSGLGKAVKYMIRHWAPLTLFLRVAGAPLDNNIVERAIKCAILNRKNAYFFKSLRGAYVGDMYMSLIHTCRLNQVNPFEYLVALLENGKAGFAAPDTWLPWNYQANLESCPQNIAV